MRTISKSEGARGDAEKLLGLLQALGRRRSLRDPMIAGSEQLNLTPAQTHAVMWLGSDGALSMGELAKRLGTTEKTMTGVVDRLERQHLAIRVRSESDRRVVRVKLTSQGTVVYRKLARLVLGSFVQLMEMLEARDRKDLLRIFERLVQRMGNGKTLRLEKTS
jgi:DNA-binding MarR family transcriptional regulator